MAARNQETTLWRLSRNSAVRFGVVILGVIIFIALLAPWMLTVNPSTMDPAVMNLAPGETALFTIAPQRTILHTFWFGGDSYGRDIYSRVLYGCRISLIVGFLASTISMFFGALLGTLAGYVRALDAVLMRVMDGLMAIPSILLALALVAALGPSIATVVIAIALPEVPRVTRLVRSIVLTLREEPFVEAAKALATSAPVIMTRHILPNALAPLIVQGTFICASAILTEAVLSFLGLGLPADIPTWGNIMADGRVHFIQHPGSVFFPAMFLIPTVLAINMLGDGLRDVLDPKFATRTAA